MTLRKVPGVLVSAVAAVLLLASPAFAAPQSLTLNPAHKNQTAAGFNQECTAPFSAGMVQDGWHFVWQQGGDFTSVTLTFNDGSSNVDITIDTPLGTPSGN